MDLPKDTTSKLAKKRTLWIRFLGSMNLAITLLLALSIASVVGTVLQQNQGYTDYIIKFGPFWFEVFKLMGLYDVYSSSWFLFILFCLVSSTTVCIYKTAPTMLREMRDYRQNVQLQTLQQYSDCTKWVVQQPAGDVRHVTQSIFSHHGYSARVREEKDRQLVSGMKGRGSRLGYILAHLAIVFICVGGLIDGNAILKARELMGMLEPEHRNLPANKVPAISRLGLDNMAFRGSVSVPEGSQTDALFINYKDGYLVQNLPFTIEVKDFRIEHYDSGQPKSFESDLVIHDDRLATPMTRTISVNHPLIYDGHAIYQASFADGGSELELRAWPLGVVKSKAAKLQSIVGEVMPLVVSKQQWSLEVDDFRLFNIMPSDDPAKKFNNVGPSVTFKLRSKTGEAREYFNYMLPIDRDGHLYYLSGVRESPADDFRYLYIPMDDEGGVGRFVTFLGLLNDTEKMQQLIEKLKLTESVLPSKEARQVNEAMLKLVQLFLKNGFEGVEAQLKKNVPLDDQQSVITLYIQVLQKILAAAYMDVLTTQGHDVSLGLDSGKAGFFTAATVAIGALERYGSPVYLQLDSFAHRQASGLQIAKAPGKNLVYPGCAMLIVGIFLMFYAPQKRLWVWMQQTDKGVEVTLVGQSSKNKMDFSKQYQDISAQFERVLIS